MIQGYVYAVVRETHVYRVATGEPQQIDIPAGDLGKTVSAQRVGELLGVDDFAENLWDYIDTAHDHSTDPNPEILGYSTELR